MDFKMTWMRFVGLYLALWMSVLVLLLFFFWPSHPSTTRPTVDPNTPPAQSSDPNSIDNENDQLMETAQPEPEPQDSDSADSLVSGCPVSCLRFIGLVLIMGALGACLHGVKSLASHCGRGDFSDKWTLWYLYRPFVGGVLALIFYLIINGGLMPKISSNNIEFFAILGISGLVGLFSQQALNKLKIISDAIFASGEETKQNATPSPKNQKQQSNTNSQGNTNAPEKTTTEEKTGETQS